MGKKNLNRKTSKTETPPEQIDRFRIEAVLGEGGFGRVYRAFDAPLQRTVALKVMHPRPEDATAFLREARNAGGLRHQAIVPIYDVGQTEEGLCYIVSQFLEGGDLASLIKQKRPDLRKAVEWVADLAQALDYAHSHGVVHRDIKPANIMLDNGRPCLVDFGMARNEDAFEYREYSPEMASYLSPEQVRGESHLVDGRSDIYSLGVVFYELLTGQQPFQGHTLPQILTLIIQGEVRPPSQIDDSIPRELDRICLKAMEVRISDRYATAGDLARDLRQFLSLRDSISAKVTGRFVAPAPSRWEELAHQLRSLQAEHQSAWADWDDAQIARYLAHTCSEEESQKIEAMAATHSDMRQALDQIQQVMETLEIDETGQIHIRRQEYLNDPELREEFAETLETYWGLDAETICQNIEEFQQKSDPMSVIQIQAYEQLFAELPDLLHAARCIATFRDWLDQPGRQFLYDTICKSSYYQWDRFLENHTVPTPFQSESEGVESHLSHCQFCRLAKRLAELKRENKNTRQLPQARQYLLEWLENILEQPSQGIRPAPPPSKPERPARSFTDTVRLTLSDTATAKLPKTRDRGGYITWLTPAAQALSAKDRIGQYESELRTIFPDSRITVSAVLPNDRDQAEQILFAVLVNDAKSTRYQIVKLGTREKVERDVAGWQTGVIKQGTKNPILLTVRGHELPLNRFAAIYEDPPCLSHCGMENTIPLETAIHQAIHNDNPRVDSVSQTLSQVFEEMRSRLHQTGEEGSLEQTLQFYKEKLNEGDNSVWDHWEYEEEYSTLREEATGFLSAHRNPRRPRQPGYCDPLTFIRWAFKEHAIPTTDFGPVHGDLHGRNILVGLKDGQACFPVVFDYSAMSASQPTVWEFVGLEVDLKSHVLPDLALDEQARQALATATTHRLRSTRHGQTTVELISRSKRADLNRSEWIEFAYQFELLLTDLLFNQEVVENQSPDDRETQTGHPALDRALQLIRRIRREAAITLIHSLHRLAAWQNEYLFALAVCGLSKIQQPLAAHQLEWCLIASGVASANLDSFSRFVATENDIALQLDSEFAIPTFLYAGKLPAELERREDTLIFTIPSGDIKGERFPFCGAGAHQSRGLEPIGPFLKQPGIRHLIIDFSQMDYISSTNVFQLVELWKHVKERDGQMVLCGLTPKFQEFMKINNLNTLWSVYPDQAEALKALHGESDGSL